MIYHNATGASTLAWEESVLQVKSSCTIPCSPVRPHEMHVFKCEENKDMKGQYIRGGFQKPEAVCAELEFRYFLY